MCSRCSSFFDLRKSEYCDDCNLHYKYFTMRTKEEILMNILKQNYTERIFKFQKLVNHDLTLKAMQEYAEEYHKSELLKLNKSDVISLLRQLLIAFIIEIILIVILVTNI